MTRSHAKAARGIVAAATAGLLLLTAGCGGNADDAASDETFDYLVVLPLSGALSAIGEAERGAINAAVDVVNASGGANGKDVVVDFVDSTGTSTQAVSVLQKALTGSKKYDFVLAGATSGEALPMMPILTKYKMPSCTTASAPVLNDPEKYPYAFGTAALSPYVADAMIESLQGLGYTKAAAIYPSTELGTAAKEAATERAKAAGISFETVEADPAATDLTSQLDRLRASDPQVLVADGFGPIAGVILKTRAKMGWDIPVLGDETLAVNNFGDIATAEELEGVTLNTQALNVTGTPTTESEEFKTYSEALAKYVDDLVFAPELYGDNYSCILLAAAGATAAGSFDPQKMAEAIEGLAGGDIPHWFLTKTGGFSPDSHYPAYGSDDYVTVKAGPRVNGLMVPAS